MKYMVMANYFDEADKVFKESVIIYNSQSKDLRYFPINSGIIVQNKHEALVFDSPEEAYDYIKSVSKANRANNRKLAKLHNLDSKNFKMYIQKTDSPLSSIKIIKNTRKVRDVTLCKRTKTTKNFVTYQFSLKDKVPSICVA